jgi:protease-4
MIPMVIRVGKYKDPAHPYAFAENIACIKENSEKMYAYFVREIAQLRGLSLADQEKWAEGRAIVGEEALELGLIDAFGGYSDALDKIHELLKERGVKVRGQLKVVEVNLN